MNYFLHTPFDISLIIEHLQAEDWFITNYEASKDDMYNPGNFLHNKEIENVHYFIIPDRNFFSYIVSSVKSNKPEERYKTAIAIILFCQTCEIDVEPNLSIYELINHDAAHIEKAAEELEIFNAINNSPQEPLFDYFTGNIDSIPLPSLEKKDRVKFKKEMMEHKWLIEWRSLYLITLKGVSLSLNKKNNMQKLEELLVWMSKEFRRSHIAIVFFMFLFSSQKRKKMIKYKQSDSKEKRYLELKNMVWDFYYMNTFIRKWQTPEPKTEFIFVSNDKVVREILRVAIAMAKTGNCEPMRELMTDTEYKHMERLHSFLNENTERVYNTDAWTEAYREKLIEDLEIELLA
jgi:hypothetical protein